MDKGHKVDLSEAIQFLACEVRQSREQRAIELEWLKSHFGSITKVDLENAVNRIMSKISEHYDAVSAAWDAIGTKVDGVADDVAYLKETIDKLNSTGGPISPEDQILLDALQVRAGATLARVTALDDATARPLPEPPVE